MVWSISKFQLFKLSMKELQEPLYQDQLLYRNSTFFSILVPLFIQLRYWLLFSLWISKLQKGKQSKVHLHAVTKSAGQYCMIASYLYIKYYYYKQSLAILIPGGRVIQCSKFLSAFYCVTVIFLSQTKKGVCMYLIYIYKHKLPCSVIGWYTSVDMSSCHISAKLQSKIRDLSLQTTLHTPFTSKSIKRKKLA